MNASGRRHRGRVVGYGLGLASCSLIAALVISADPGGSLLLLVAGIVGAVLLTKPNLATGLLAASFYFDNYLVGGTLHVRPELTDSLARLGLSDGFLSLSKIIGLVAVAAVGIQWARRARRVVQSPELWAIAGLAGVLLISAAAARDESAAVMVGSRYAMFFVLFFLVLQSVRTRRDAERLADVVVIAAGISAYLGLAAYFGEHVDRASGPLEDPGDFGFLLASTVPLALYRLRGTSGRRSLVTGTALLLMFAAILLSFSRAALVGLVVAGVWGILTRRLRIRWGVMALLGILFAGTVAYQVEPALIESTFEQKQNIAQQNVDVRLTFWRVALEQWDSSPVVGVGPGNYVSRYTEFQFPYEHEVTTPHNAYLHILAELGLLGLALFVGYIALAWRQLRVRAGAKDRNGAFRDAIAGSFLVALVGSFFMTQQFYPPLWFFPALGVALVLSAPRADSDVEPPRAFAAAGA